MTSELETLQQIGIKKYLYSILCVYYCLILNFILFDDQQFRDGYTKKIFQRAMYYL